LTLFPNLPYVVIVEVVFSLLLSVPIEIALHLSKQHILQALDSFN